MTSTRPAPANQQLRVSLAAKPSWLPAPASQQMFSTVLFLLGGAVFFLLANLVVFSQLQHYVTQKNLYADIRLTLANGSIPVSPVDHVGQPVAPGTPVALMRAPDIGIGDEVIVEGTSASQTMVGIGHRRDSVLPCQVGSSVLMARTGAYGGIGQLWKSLKPGDQFSISMGQGSCTYDVMDQRHVGDTAPPPPTGREGRLVLTTAEGLPYMPTEVLRIDAKLVTDAYDRPTSVFPTAALPASDAAMGSQLRLVLDGKAGVDLATPFGIILLLEALIAAGIGAVWLWRRWGRWQTWLIASPVILTIGLMIAGNANAWFLPNLL